MWVKIPVPVPLDPMGLLGALGKVAGTTLRPLPDGCELDAPSLDLSEAPFDNMMGAWWGGQVVGTRKKKTQI